jgi:flagellar biosynthesis protein FliR
MDEMLKLFDYVLQTFNAGQSPQTFLVLVALAFARMVAFVNFAPFFGGKIVSGRVKVAIAVSFVIIAYPALAAQLPTDGSPLPFGPLGFIFLMAKEFFVGFTLAFVASSVFEGIQMAGRFIDIQRGSSMSEIMAPQLQEKVSEIGQFQFQYAIVLFFFIGGHQHFIRALIESFYYIPATSFPNFTSSWSPAAELITNTAFHSIFVGVQLSLPIVLALLMTDLFFGIVNKVSPQINVFFLSMPVKMGLGAFLLWIMLPSLQEQILYYFTELYKTFEFMIQYLGTKPAF